MLSWKVYWKNFNKRTIEHKDIFEGEYLANCAKEIKETAKSKEDFSIKFDRLLMYHYWCKAEYEVVITSWPPYIKTEDLEKINKEAKDKIRININPEIAKKIDIYDQLKLNWDVFIDYVFENC